MASLSRRAEDAISELWQRYQQLVPDEGCGRMGTWLLIHLSVLKDELRIRILVDCVKRWSDLEDVLQLASLLGQIEDIENKFIQNIHLPLVERPPNRSLILKIWKKITIRRKLSKLDSMATPFYYDLWNLHREITSRAYDSSWSSQSIEFRFDYDRWKEFAKFIDNYLEASSRLHFNEEIESQSSLKKQFEILNRYLDSAKGFIDCLQESSSKDLKIHVMIVVGRVAITAALQLCHWWSDILHYSFKPKIDRCNLLELQQKIDFTSPEFLDMNLKLLRDQNGDGIGDQVNQFLKCLFPLEKDFANYLHLEEPHALHGELKSLVISVATFPREDVATSLFAFVRRVLNMVAREAASYHYASTGTVTDKNMLQAMLTEIWFVKLEIFLREQLNTCAILQKEQIDALRKGLADFNYEEWLKSLKTTIKHSSNTEQGKHDLAVMEEISTHLHPSFDAQEMTIINESVRNLLFKLLLMHMLFKADILVRYFLFDNDQTLVVIDKNQTEALHKSLEFFIIFVKDQPAISFGKAKLVFEHIEQMASGVCSLFNSIHTRKTGEEACKNMDPLVSDMLEKINPIMVELKVFLHSPNIPKLGSVDPFLEKLRELLNADVATYLKDQIEEILRELEFLAHFIEDILEQDIEFQGLKDLRARLADVAYKAEHYIDSVMLEDSVEWHNSLWLYHLREDIRLVKAYLPTTRDKIHRVKEPDMSQIPVQIKGSRATTSSIDENPVVLNDQQEMIIDRLIAGPEQLDIVQIVGLPGIGKTTLAMQVYNCPSVVYNFHVRTWCCISQIYSRREMLLEILSHITSLSDDNLVMTDEDLEERLRKHLLKRKFLIVMDDLWSTKALNDLRQSLPNDGNQSRILITSRQDLKASPDAVTHCLRLLSDSESWNLLEKKIFREECCTDGLMQIGEKIAKSCKGLPLAIVAVAGLLQKRERQSNSWNEIAKDLSFLIVDDPEELCRKILELSYNDLPDYQKACFLYFGAFLEDQGIPTRKLVQLWTAEGLVRKDESKSLEDVAEGYLMDLIDRSLVILSQKRSRGGVKACRVHDVLHKFCQSKAKEEKFLKVITGYDDSMAPQNDLNYVFSANTGSCSSPVTYEDHRLCFCSKWDHLIESRPSGPCTRSLLCFATDDNDPKCPYDISFISDNFTLLNVLDLECINTGNSFPKGIERLLHLRYLAIAGYIDSIPTSISNLLNLETLVVKGLSSRRAISIPSAIWCLKKLRHLHVSPFAIISLQDDRNPSGFSDLVSISLLVLPFGEETKYILRKLSNVRKLKCIFLEPRDNSPDCNNFPRLEVLNQLESLKISYHGQALLSCEFCLPSNLKKLTLSNFHLPWDKISTIGKLRHLEVLKLLSGAFEGDTWDMVEGEFSELKYLKLDSLNIAEWNAWSDDLPKLRQLVLRCCSQLKEVPSCIGEIPTLESINVLWCGDRVEMSVRQIKNDGDENLKVFINFAELQISET